MMTGRPAGSSFSFSIDASSPISSVGIFTAPSKWFRSQKPRPATFTITRSGGLFHIVERLFGGQSAEVLLHIGISFVLLGFMVYLPAALEAGAEEYESENVSFTAVAPFLIA